MDKWLSPVFKVLYGNKKFTDCKIFLGHTSFDCHKVILSSASEYFNRKFLEEKAESCEFSLEFVTVNILEKLPKYVYTYDEEELTTYTTPELENLLKCGKEWTIPSLIDECILIILERIPLMNIGDLVNMFEFGCSFNEKKLIDAVTKALRVEQYKGKLNCVEALNLSLDLFKKFYEAMFETMSYVDRFQLIEDYMRYERYEYEDENAS